jgi:hypothetical protein
MVAAAGPAMKLAQSMTSRSPNSGVGMQCSRYDVIVRIRAASIVTICQILGEYDPAYRSARLLECGVWFPWFRWPLRRL